MISFFTRPLRLSSKYCVNILNRCCAVVCFLLGRQWGFWRGQACLVLDDKISFSASVLLMFWARSFAIVGLSSRTVGHGGPALASPHWMPAAPSSQLWQSEMFRPCLTSRRDPNGSRLRTIVFWFSTGEITVRDQNTHSLNGQAEVETTRNI